MDQRENSLPTCNLSASAHKCKTESHQMEDLAIEKIDIPTISKTLVTR